MYLEVIPLSILSSWVFYSSLWSEKRLFGGGGCGSSRVFMGRKWSVFEVLDPKVVIELQFHHSRWY